MSTDVSGRTTRLRQFMKAQKVNGNTLCALCFSFSHQRTNLSPFTKDSRGREEKNETMEYFFRLSDFAELFNQQKNRQLKIDIIRRLEISSSEIKSNNWRG